MKTPFSFKEDPFDIEVNHILKQMASMEPESTDYKAAVDNLKTLTEARGQKTNSTISADTIVSGVVSLLGILLILNHEKLDVITSKSISFIPKMR